MPAGSTLLEAADAADVHLNASCNGKGSCGKCKLVVESGDLAKTSTPLLSDQAKAKGYIIDRSGKFFNDIPGPYVRRIKDEWVYVLAFADQTPMGEDIIFTESDVKNLMYSKGAVYAGFTTLLKIAGLQFAMIDKVIISGGFGRYIDIEKAVRIGLLPDIERSKFVYLGNSSIVGAYMALLSGEYRHEAARLCSQMTYIDFSSHPNYMDEFTSALFLPHTNLDMFPSVVARPA